MIRLLDDLTIDKIAAGEVIERPVSVVKELVENSIDAGSKEISVEIKNGGVDYIRVTDDGMGISFEEVPKAFLRHATSKIQNSDDLFFLCTLGFRGEALASIVSVSHTEMITRYNDELMGTRIVLAGGDTKEYFQTGAPKGTTIIVKDLFYNVPARKKFLKSAVSEANKIIDLMEELALSNPDISFQLLVNKQVKIQTNGNGKLKDTVYRLFKKDIYDSLIPLEYEDDRVKIYGYITKPCVSRSSRESEYYFVNKRFVSNEHITRGIEEGYKNFLMQHQFPFVVLFLTLDTAGIDVNVHPAKKEIRITNGEFLVELLNNIIRTKLTQTELMPNAVTFEENITVVTRKPEPFEKSSVIKNECISSDNESENSRKSKEFSIDFVEESIEEEFDSEKKYIDNTINNELSETSNLEDASNEFSDTTDLDDGSNDYSNIITVTDSITKENVLPENTKNRQINDSKSINPVKAEIIKESQAHLFEEKSLTKEKKYDYRILGQVFDTYWLISVNDELLVMDQHAAHEKVLFEKFMKNFKESTIEIQRLLVPTVLNLSRKEKEVYESYVDIFEKFGFEVQDFGENEIILRGIPADLFGGDEKQLFLEMLGELMQISPSLHIPVIEERIATRACKAAVKGNQTISLNDCQKLLDYLFTLENPYQCPHGRPTFIRFSKTDLEKMFKRIV